MKKRSNRRRFFTTFTGEPSNRFRMHSVTADYGLNHSNAWFVWPIRGFRNSGPRTGVGTKTRTRAVGFSRISCGNLASFPPGAFRAENSAIFVGQRTAAKIERKKPPSAWRKTYYFPPRTFEYPVRVVAEDTRSPASDEFLRVSRCRNSIGRLGPTRPRERDIKRLPFASATGHSDFRDTTPSAYCPTRVYDSIRFRYFAIDRVRARKRSDGQ